MASSPAHRFGQIIGDLVESTMINYLNDVAQDYSLYLDYRHPRKARNSQNGVIWVDINKNKHKLDIVMEDGGTEESFGIPRVFIEVAWRKYTKHSKNKVQEISGAILPLIEKYRRYSPFYGAVLAGVFTSNSLKQLRSEGFNVVHFRLDTIVSAFKKVGIDASWEENTPEIDLQYKVQQFEQLTKAQSYEIQEELIYNNKSALETFKQNLCLSLERRIESIRILSVYGNQIVFNSAQEACNYIANFYEDVNSAKFYKFEIYIKYSNRDKIEMQFQNKENAIQFLQRFI